MLPHHAQVFRELQANNPDAEVYISTSDKVEPPKSPFGFDEKISIMQNALDIPEDRVLRVKSPYNNREYEQYFDPENTQLIFVVGEKDMKKDPRFRFPEDGLDLKVKTGEPKYLQSINTVNMGILPMSQRGYVMTAPTVTVDGEAASATKFRNAMLNASDLDHAKEIYTQYFGEFNQQAFNTIYNKIGDDIMKEQIKEMRILAGLDTIVEGADMRHNYHVKERPDGNYEVVEVNPNPRRPGTEYSVGDIVEPGEYQHKQYLSDGGFFKVVDDTNEAAPVDFSGKKSIYTGDNSSADLGRLLMKMGEDETEDLELANALSELGGDLVHGTISSGRELTDFVKNTSADQGALLQKISNAMDAYNRGERAETTGGEPEPEDTMEETLNYLKKMAGLISENEFNSPQYDRWKTDRPDDPAESGQAEAELERIESEVRRGDYSDLVQLIDDVIGLDEFMDENRDAFLAHLEREVQSGTFDSYDM